jgi:hypothetical protein
VDLDARLVERWRPEDVRPEILSGELTWKAPDAARISLDLPRLFESVLGPDR